MVRNKNTSQFVGFCVGGQDYAFRIEQIQEIVILKEITRTPQVPDYVEGVANLRGTIIPIISLRCLLGLEPIESDAETRTIVVNVGDRTMGCTVDSVSQVIRLQDETIQPAPDVMSATNTGYITGFAKLQDTILVILNINELLDPEKLDQVQQAAAQGLSLSEPTDQSLNQE